MAKVKCFNTGNDNPFYLYDDNMGMVKKATKSIKTIVDQTIKEIDNALEKAARKIRELEEEIDLGIDDTLTAEHITGYFSEQLEKKEIQDEMKTKKTTLVDTFYEKIHYED